MMVMVMCLGDMGLLLLFLLIGWVYEVLVV